MARTSRLRRTATLLAGALAGSAFLWLVYQGFTWSLRPEGEDPEAAYQATAVALGVLREKVVATGALEPYKRVVVQSEIPGIVTRVLVEDGQRVSVGQALVELDREPLEDLVAELQAGLAARQALARYDLVGRAEAERDKRRLDLGREQQLNARGVAAPTELEDAEYALRLAEIAVTDAHAEKAARRARVEEIRNTLRRAERSLEKTTIRSPTQGIVVRRRVEVGSAVADIQNGGTLVAELADDRRLHLLAQVDENDVAGVRLEQEADVRIDAFPDEPFTGRVRKVASSGQGEGAVASFDVEIELEPDERLRVGMSADARIVVREHRQVLLLPNAAIVHNQEGPRVRVAEGGNGRFRLAPVRTGASDGFETVVTEGLAEGEQVLVRGGERS
jgi:HlyD family secretion protein